MAQVLNSLDSILAPSRSALLIVDVQNDFIHPDGWAATTKTFPLSDLTPSPRYEEIVRAFDGYGERVAAPDALPGALQRALRAVREERRQAVLNVVCQR